MLKGRPDWEAGLEEEVTNQYCGASTDPLVTADEKPPVLFNT